MGAEGESLKTHKGAQHFAEELKTQGLLSRGETREGKMRHTVRSRGYWRSNADLSSLESEGLREILRGDDFHRCLK